eukprot:SAG11_NODE_485_length_9035_cov_16.221352_6_plen_53_part_00
MRQIKVRQEVTDLQEEHNELVQELEQRTQELCDIRHERRCEPCTCSELLALV